MGEREEGSDASGNGPAVFGGKSLAVEAGAKSAFGPDPPGGGLVRIGKRAAQVHDAPEGRPNYPLLLIVKILLLEQWYNLSNPQMEETLGDRISFRHFVGLGLQEDAPNHSAISRCRTAMAEWGMAEELLMELGRQLEERGLVLK